MSVPFKSLTTSILLDDKELLSSDYDEIDNLKISLKKSPKIDSVLIIKYEPLLNLPVISHSTKSISFFKTFNSNENLKANQKYDLNLKIKNTQINSSFISKCIPYYSSVKKIKEDLGALSDSIREESINYFIYLNSKELDEVIEDNDIDVAEGMPTYAKKWVRYKTDIDLANSIYLSICGKESLISKRIGPITIESRHEMPDINDMLLRFKEEFRVCDNILNSGGESMASVSASFIKGGTAYPYPIDTRNSF